MWSIISVLLWPSLESCVVSKVSFDGVLSYWATLGPTAGLDVKRVGENPFGTGGRLQRSVYRSHRHQYEFTSALHDHCSHFFSLV